MTVETRLGTASGSKTLTALAVLSLVEDGTLSLSTTARSLLGTDLPLVADDVTVEQLLCHRSGIGDYFDEDDPDFDESDYLMPVPVHELATTEAFVPILGGHPTQVPGRDVVLLLQRRVRRPGAARRTRVGDRLPRPGGAAGHLTRRHGRHRLPALRRAAR